MGSSEWWHISIVSVLRRLKQEDQELESVIYTYVISLKIIRERYRERQRQKERQTGCT